MSDFSDPDDELLVAQEDKTLLLYPIYIDAKRPFSNGNRRIKRDLALEWPRADVMAQACKYLGLEARLESTKTHPRDWANPGRVRVTLTPKYKNKRAVLLALCFMLKPHEKPEPSIAEKYPPDSPMISYGMLDGAGNDMLSQMMGGAGDDEPAQAESLAKIKTMPKPRRVHVKRR